VFWKCIEIRLQAVANEINSELKSAINALFVSLQSAVEDLLRFTGSAELNRAIRTAQTGVQYALNQVVEWFRLQKGRSEQAFSFEEIVEIGLQCVKNIHPDFEPNVEQFVSSMPPLLNLALFSDVFFIVFDNIQKHSGLEMPAVEIRASLDADHLRIVVNSEVATSIDLSEAEVRVDKIRQDISEGSYQRGVRSEGGTGLMKLRKIIGNTRRPKHLDFGFDHRRWFFVELEIPMREIPT
jgi:K+-sensing histidine kinase KdpD